MSHTLDRYWMQHCLRLAQQAAGFTSPNPMVGSVVVQGSERVGSGFHPAAGQPHAEVFALREAGSAAMGATLYVNLEPCNHFGRTPPCTEAILKAGIRRVVAGMTDPNPLVAGQGLARLQAAGVEVSVGIEEVACRKLNEAFCFAIQHKRCFGILKYAMTLDGKIASHTGHSQWISNAQSRQSVHQLRGIVDAVVVGSGTVRRDDPQLTNRLADPVRQPLRVVLSRSLDLPKQAQLWDQSVAQTLVMTEPESSPEMQKILQDHQVEVRILPQLTPLAVSEWLYQRGCLSALWECGGTLASVALSTGSIQKVMAFIAPKIIGGSAAPSPVGGIGIDSMAAAFQLRDLEMTQIGSDWLVVGYV